MTSQPELRIASSSEGLASDVAEHLLVLIRDAQAEGRTPHVVLTGGTIADAIHAAVASASASAGIDWKNVAFWWGDERFVAPDSSDRNALQARAAFLDHVGVDPALVFEMPSSSSGMSLDEAAESYGAQVRGSEPHEFDVVMLGMGPDGHVASLFPGFPQVVDHSGIAYGVTDSPKPPPSRITLSMDALNHTRATWLVVSGSAKASAVAQALSYSPAAGLGQPPTDDELLEIPARGVHGSKETIWFLDTESASELP